MEPSNSDIARVQCYRRQYEWFSTSSDLYTYWISLGRKRFSTWPQPWLLRQVSMLVPAAKAENHRVNSFWNTKQRNGFGGWGRVEVGSSIYTFLFWGSTSFSAWGPSLPGSNPRLPHSKQALGPFISLALYIYNFTNQIFMCIMWPSYVQKSFISFISTTAHLLPLSGWILFLWSRFSLWNIFKNCENCINSNYCYSRSTVAKTLLYLAPLSNPYLKNYK